MFTLSDLVHRKAASEIRRNLLDIMIDMHIAGGGGRIHQTVGIDVLCRKIAVLRRKLLVEMTGDTAMYHP